MSALCDALHADSTTVKQLDEILCRVEGSATPSACPVVAAGATETRREASDTTLFSSDEVFVPTRSRAVHNHTGTLVHRYIITPVHNNHTSATKLLWPAKPLGPNSSPLVVGQPLPELELPFELRLVLVVRLEPLPILRSLVALRRAALGAQPSSSSSTATPSTALRQQLVRSLQRAQLRRTSLAVSGLSRLSETRRRAGGAVVSLTL